MDPIEIARASVLGQPIPFSSPVVASAFLLVGMVNRDLGDYQRYAFKWMFITSIVLTLLALLTGVISFR